MGWSVKIVADSLSPKGGRLTTYELCYPRFIHSEFMTHRVLSRNAQSSRATPIEKMIERVIEDPAMPVEWGRNQKGMQAGEPLTEWETRCCKSDWLHGRDYAVDCARRLLAMGAHKQVVNRVLEPFSWITVVASATEWNNFFWQRCSTLAQPEFKYLATLMLSCRIANEVAGGIREVPIGGWHTPYVREDEQDLPLHTRLKVSVARCARVSYLGHDGVRSITKDLELYRKLTEGGHWSPFEHVAQAAEYDYDCLHLLGNFSGWKQYRKKFRGENQTLMTPAAASCLLGMMSASGVDVP